LLPDNSWHADSLSFLFIQYEETKLRQREREKKEEREENRWKKKGTT